MNASLSSVKNILALPRKAWTKDKTLIDELEFNFAVSGFILSPKRLLSDGNIAPLQTQVARKKNGLEILLANSISAEMELESNSILLHLPMSQCREL